MTITVEEIAKCVRSRELSASAVVQQAFNRIERCDPVIRGWVCTDPRALEFARSSIPKGALAGVPFGVKDLIDVEGLPSALGLSATEYVPYTAMDSAAAVLRLEAAGAIGIGKTTTSALGLDRPAPTRNPLDLARSPGASSSGSAAVVAAGMVPMTVGSQALGSVIRPASYCGLWAFVPSHGVVPSHGMLVLSNTLDRIGIFTSSVHGLVLAGRVLLLSEESSGKSDAAPSLRVGLIENPDLASCAPEPTTCLRRLLRESAIIVQPLPMRINLAGALAATRSIIAFELHEAAATGRAPLATLSRTILRRLAPPPPTLQSYLDALAFRRHLAAAWERITTHVDAVLLPSAAAEAPLGVLDNQDSTPAVIGSLLGLPTVNVPLFRSSNGLPIGGQLLGKKGADLTILLLAKRFARNIAC